MASISVLHPSASGSLQVLARVASSARVAFDGAGNVQVEQSDGTGSGFSITILASSAVQVNGPAAEAGISLDPDRPQRLSETGNRVRLHMDLGGETPQQVLAVQLTAIPN
ncbi:MAG: hypothetical protein ACLGPM_08095 [Acidobacteriota bacterium]